MTVAQFERAGVATLTFFVAGTDFIEEFVQRGLAGLLVNDDGTDDRGGQPTMMQIALFGVRNQTFGQRLEVLSHAAGHADATADDEFGDEIAKFGLPFGSRVWGFKPYAGFAVYVIASLCSHEFLLLEIPEAKTDRIEFFFNFFERFLAEIAHLHHFLFRFLGEFHDGGDACSL